LIVAGFLVGLVLVLVGAICALALRKTMRITVPLCEAHRNHFLSRSLFVYIGLGVFLLLQTIALAAFFLTRDPAGEWSDLAGYFCGGTFFVGLAWLFGAAILQNGAIRATEMTDKDVTLIKVSDRFVDALRGSNRWAQPADE
jgi:hypothetical protein